MRLLVVPLFAVLAVAGCASSSSPSGAAPASAPASPATASSAPAPASASAKSSATPAPTFADVSKGDSNSVVKLLSYDRDALSVVVEPTIFMQGPDFCDAFGLPADDSRCNREWSTEDSKTRVTLPVAEDAKLLTIKGGNPECMDEKTADGTCALTPATFADLVENQPEMMVRAKVAGGTVVRLAEVYTP